MRICLTSILLFFMVGLYAQISDFKNVSFHKSDSIANSYLGADLKSVPKLSYLLTKDLETDVEKLRSIFIWISRNIENDHLVYLKNKRKRKQFRNDSIKLFEWNKEIQKKTLETLLKKKRTVCTGYAFLLKKMCKYAGIQSEIINGYSKTGGTELEDLQSPNHSWNAVLINSKWYLCDPTWASGIFNPNTSLFEFDYQKGYFLTEAKLFVKNHYPSDPKWTLITENNPTYEEFTEGPILYNSAFKYAALYKSPLKMYNTIAKKESVSFQINLLKSSPTVNEVYLMLSGKRKDVVIEPENLILNKEVIQFDYQFRYKGYYDVHLMLDGEVIMTYAFHVKRKD